MATLLAVTMEVMAATAIATQNTRVVTKTLLKLKTRERVRVVPAAPVMEEQKQEEVLGVEVEVEVVVAGLHPCAQCQCLLCL